jgi:hypothetical protein
MGDVTAAILPGIFFRRLHESTDIFPLKGLSEECASSFDESLQVYATDDILSRKNCFGCLPTQSCCRISEKYSTCYSLVEQLFEKRKETTWN